MNDIRNSRRTTREDAAGAAAPRGISAVVSAAVAATVLAGSLFVLRWRQDEPDPPPPSVALYSQRGAGSHPVRLIPRRRASTEGSNDRTDTKLPPVRQSDEEAIGGAAADGTAVDNAEVVIDNLPGRDYPRGIDAAEYIQALRDMGETEGLAAFNPPGTNPPRAGIIVPDGYAVPEGFARYHQSTDDGVALAPILIYSPDYDFFDADGNPIEVPDDRVVRAEHAPDDLRIEMLDPEQPRQPSGLIGQDD